MKKANNIKNSNKPLRSNPFITYRDPKTGSWVVVKPQRILNNGNVELVSVAA